MNLNTMMSALPLLFNAISAENLAKSFAGQQTANLLRQEKLPTGKTAQPGASMIPMSKREGHL